MSALNYRALDEHGYAIVNPLQVASSQWRDLPATALVPKSLKNQSHLMPLLVDLTALSREIRSELFSRAEAWDEANDEPYFSALLQSSVKLPRLTLHLVAQLLIKNASGASCVLRFYDPRVFQHLDWIMSADQMSALLGPITLWTWRDAKGQWYGHRRGEYAVAGRLRPSIEQWERLSRIGLLNRTLLQLARKDVDFFPDSALSERIDRLLAESFLKDGLRDEADRRLYVEQAFKLHPSIHLHPDIAARLALARNGKCTYVGACDDMDEDTLERIIADLSSLGTRMHA